MACEALAAPELAHAPRLEGEEAKVTQRRGTDSPEADRGKDIHGEK